MAGLIWGGASFLLAFLAHLAVWRIRLPARQTKTLLLMMFSALGAAVLLLRAAGPALSARYGWSVPETAGDYLHLVLINTSLILAYMITYSAMEADSPSLVIVTSIAETGEAGFPENDLAPLINDDKLIRPRIRDLLRDKMAVLENGRYRLTPKGRCFAVLFSSFRKVLGRGKGG